jgi:hypothetical protein
VAVQLADSRVVLRPTELVSNEFIEMLSTWEKS